MSTKKSRFPDSLVLIFAMIVVAQVLTYLLPAGEFEREGRRVLEGSYHAVDAARLPLHAFLSRIPEGMMAAADIIFFVFITGGVIGVIRASGAIDSLIGAAIRHVGGRPILLIAGMTSLFALGSATIGMAEEYVPFVPILVTMSLALGMDAVVALGIMFVGYGVGYGCAAYNPFTVLIAQDIAGLPAYSGQLFRWCLFVVCLVVGVHHIMRYARRVRDDPSKSLVRDVDYSEGFQMPEDVRFTPARGIILSAFAGGIVFFIWGVKVHEWYLTELATILLVVALLSALLGRISPNRVARTFCAGAGELTTTALLIGFARTIEVILDEGRVIDTVIHGVSQPLAEAGPSVAAVGMFAVQTVCNLFIPSGSGQAYVTMPIMAPLSDLVGVTRQTAVLAYHMGDGFTNTIVPTNAVLMGMLGLGHIAYERWLRFILPFLLKMYAIGVIALIIAVQIGYA
jgi:uncharacterized ion transporter superfamily protein YfcC